MRGFYPANTLFVVKCVPRPSPGSLRRASALPSDPTSPRKEREEREEERHFLTQITRTTAAFASAEVPFAVTPFAFKNSRTVSAVTSTPCAAGAALVAAAVATTAVLSSATPANFPLSSSAAAPEKPKPGGGDSARSPLVPTGVTAAFQLLAPAAPPWLCGSAIPMRSTLAFAAPSASASGFSPRAP